MLIDVVCGDILCYEEEENEWRKIGELLMPRYNCLAEIIDDQLVMVGGCLSSTILWESPTSTFKQTNKCFK